MSYWLVTVPNDGKPPDAVVRKLRDETSGSAQTFPMELPKLLVGTLDSLMSLDEDLAKTDGLVENVVRKVEKQYEELAGKGREELLVGKVLPERYTREFEWDFARYAPRQPLPALVSQMKAGVGKIEEELRSLVQVYGDKSAQLAGAQRKKGSNLVTADLNDALDEDKLRGLTIVDTEHLVTVFVAMPRSLEKEWLETYETIGEDIAALGNPDWSNNKSRLGSDDGQYGPEYAEGRTEKRGSPVVPGSTAKVMEEADSVLYVVTILRGQYQAGFFDGDDFQSGMSQDYVQAFKKAAKEGKYTVRDFTYDPEQAGEAEREEERLRVEVTQLNTGLIRWSKTHYGEAVVAWMHLKMIRAFVESVLRYGLPVDLSTVLLQPSKGKENALHQTLDGMYASVMGVESFADSEEDKKDSGDYLNYVVNKFSLLSTS